MLRRSLSCSVLCVASLAFASGTTVTFDQGVQGFVVNGHDVPSADGGNPGAMLHWNNFVDTFFLELRTSENPAFLGDLSRYGTSVTLSTDVKCEFIRNFFGNSIPRDIVLELRDFDNAPRGYPYVSVFKVIGSVSGSTENWRRFETTFDPTSSTLPSGWGGTGAEDPNTFEPRLPANRTFASVLASVDQVLFTTAEPGFFYVFSFFNMKYDNVSISSTPACNSIDFNGDGLFPTDEDLVDFFAVYAGGTCSTSSCGTIDFNNDGLFPDDGDILAFLQVFAGGEC
jgi:hypothetical protein